MTLTPGIKLGNYEIRELNWSFLFGVSRRPVLLMKAVDEPQAALSQINVVLNWFEELKKKVPTGK